MAIEFPVDFEEQDVKSLKLNDVNVETAAAGTEVGIARDERTVKLKPGLAVYVLKPS
jgi:translation initiation factor IF-2